MSGAHATQRARELRRVSTPAERRLWKYLRDRQFHGLKDVGRTEASELNGFHGR